MVIGASNYRDILKAELKQRSEVNGRYSMRAFANYLGMSPGSICDIINGKQGISNVKAKNISEKLGFDQNETEYFLTLVEKTHARSRAKRDLAKTRLKELQLEDYHELHLDSMKVISEWYHFAILELTYLDNFIPDIDWAAAQLGVNAELIQDAIERLERLNLLEVKNGKWIDLNNYLMTSNGIPSRSIRRLHHQIICKAHQAVEEQNVEERNLSSLILSFDEDQMDEAKEMIQEFQVRFNKKMGAGKKKNKVYCLAVQFFNLTTANGGEICIKQ